METKKERKVLLSILGYSPVVITVIFILAIFWFFIKIVIGTIYNSLTYSEVTLLLYTSLMMGLLALLINLVVFMVFKTLSLLRLEKKRMESTSELFYIFTMILPIITAFLKKRKKSKGEKEEK